MNRRWLFVVGLLPGCPRPPDALPGCFDIEGGPNFSVLQEAVDAAESGDTIRVCAGPSSGEVVIQGKDLTIEGRDDNETFFYSEGTAFVVRDAEVTITDLSVSAMESAAKVFDGVLHWKGANVEEVGGTFIEAYDSDLQIDHSDFRSGPLGGIRVEGGTLDLRESSLRRVNSYGVLLAGGVTAVIEDNEFEDVFYTGNASYLFTADGIGVQTTNFDQVRLARNTFEDISIAAVQIENGSLTMDGDVITGGYAGLLTLAGTLSLSDVRIESQQNYGIYARTSTVSLTNVDIVIVPEESAGADGSGSAGSIGLNAPGTDVTMTGGSIVGANGGGIVASALSAVTLPDVVLDGVLLQGNGRFGVAVDQGTLIATDVTVDGTRDRDEICTSGTTGEKFCSAGVWLLESGGTWTGGAITNNPTFGVWVQTGRFEGLGVEIRGSDVAAAAYDASIVLADAVLADNGQYGVYVDGGSADVRRSSISGGHGTTVYSEERDGVVHAWETTGGGADIYVEGGVAAVTEVTFADGDQGVVLGAGATGEVRDATFSGYTQRVLSVEGGKLEAAGVTATETGGDAAVCVDGELWLERVVFDRVQTWVADTAYTVDGNPVEATSELRVDPGLRGLRCLLVAENVELRDVAGIPASWWNGVFEADGLIVDKGLSGITDAGATAIELAWTDRAPAAVLEDVTIANLYRGDGLSLSIAEGLEPGFIELMDVSVVDAPGDGVVLQGGTHRLSGVTVTGAGGYGMTCDAALPPAFAACDVSLSGTAGAALDCSGCP